MGMLITIRYGKLPLYASSGQWTIELRYQRRYSDHRIRTRATRIRRLLIVDLLSSNLFPSPPFSLYSYRLFGLELGAFCIALTCQLPTPLQSG